MIRAERACRLDLQHKTIAVETAGQDKHLLQLQQLNVDQASRRVCPYGTTGGGKAVKGSGPICQSLMEHKTLGRPDSCTKMSSHCCSLNVK